MLSFKDFLGEKWTDSIKSAASNSRTDLFINPNKKDWKEILAKSQFDDARFIVFLDGTIYVWSADGPLHMDLLKHKQISKKIDEGTPYFGGFIQWNGDFSFNNTDYLEMPKGKQKTQANKIISQFLP